MSAGSALIRSIEVPGNRMAFRDKLILSLQIAAWFKLSRTGKLSRDLAFDSGHRGMTWRTLFETFERIRNEAASEEIARSFRPCGGTGASMDAVQLSNVFQLASNLEDGGFFGREFVDEVLEMLAREKEFAESVLPAEVVRLMLEVADIRPGERIYTPFDNCLQLSIAVEEQSGGNAPVFAEFPEASALPWLLRLFYGSASAIKEGDPVLAPSYFSGERTLDRFDTALAVLPFSKKYARFDAGRDPLERFPEATASAGVLALRHILAQTKKRAVAAVANSLLFSSGAERALREHLVDTGKIEAVIGLPSALLAGSSVAFSLLVLKLDAPSETIRFIDGATEDAEGLFFTKDGKGRATLSGWRRMADLYRSGATDRHANQAARSEVRPPEYRLEVSRYCLSEQERAVETYLFSRDTKVLSEIAEIIRPVPPLRQDAGEEGAEALELEVSSLPRYGPAKPAGKLVFLREKDLENDKGRSFLRTGDVVLAVKGRTGRVGIIGTGVSEARTPPWVASQSCLVLRVRNADTVPPEYLYMYLRSDLGKSLLKVLTSGMLVPLIHLRQLSGIPVVIPSAEKKRQALEYYLRQSELERSIAEARKEQSRLLDALFSGGD